VLSPLFFEALKQYYQSNGKKKPQSIIIYRDGVGTSQYAEVVSKELPQLIVAIREFDPNWKPEIVALVVNKRVNQRFFLNNANPHAGIVVDSSVVWDHYNFYLMSHNVNAGCMTPTHYNIVVNDSQITAKALYELTYNLCYMYYNWQGGIRVPAPCMYAHKIAYLVGKHTGVAFDPRLAPSFFYL
jgi:aubergine-like protein